MNAQQIIQFRRGVGRLRPENTLESFEQGWRLGTVPEADVRSTKDGVILAFHDDALGQVIAASTDYGCVRKWKQLLPRSQTLLWMGATEQRLRERIEELRAAEFEDITQLQVHVDIRDRAAGDPFVPSSEFLRSAAEELRRRGILFQALPKWQAIVDEYHRLMDLGVESFATDDPEVALEAVSTYHRKG